MRVLEGKRIFIVEDDVVNMAVYSVALKQQGAVVIQDPWNANALELLSRYLPLDVILLDLRLRWGISGYDILEKIKAVPGLAAIPVIAVSASDPTVEIPKAQACGFAGFISKPIQLCKFFDQVACCMEGQAVWDTGQ